jgi:DNA-binding response OmpR family regulator
MADVRNVLLVEDDVLICELYRNTLVASQYTVETAGSADELYEKLLQFQPDCILLDLMLPGVSGVEILKELRTNPSHGCLTTKIVVLTNLSPNNASDAALTSGADAYVIKAEILPKDLVEIITAL